MANTVFINFRGGIISPGHLYNILIAVQKTGAKYVRFGLRQQLMVDLENYNVRVLTGELEKLNVPYDLNDIKYPNIISSFAAEEIFIRNTWLSEGVYKDIFDEISYEPTLKVNIGDSNQSFTPMLTGNINWIASVSSLHYWHLIIRFPKTNIIYEWDQLCYTNDIPKVTRAVEAIILSNPAMFIDNTAADGQALFSLLHKAELNIKPAPNKIQLPLFNLPYYEGLNHYDNKYWLGIYRRDELFAISFLRELCQLCMHTKLGHFCCTSWKTLMIKGIEEKDKRSWNLLLEKHEVNMRHAANELNFQVEDNSTEAARLKNFLVHRFGIDDTRTFGICIGIKTRRRSEIFSSILVRRRYLIDLPFIKLVKVYDILCAKDFNPNERTEEVFASGLSKLTLSEQLHRCVTKYYRYRGGLNNKTPAIIPIKPNPEKKEEFVHQCVHCKSVYDPVLGEPFIGIAANTSFENLPITYECPVCEATKDAFINIKKSALGLQAV